MPRCSLLHYITEPTFICVMSDLKDVETYIEEENRRRGRGPDIEPEDEGEKKSHNERLKESILDEAKAAD